MSRILILSDDPKTRGKVLDDLAPLGHQVEADRLDALQRADERLSADLVLVDLTTNQQAPSDTLRTSHNPALFEDIPVIGFLLESQLGTLGPECTIDDFILMPWKVAELCARAERALQRPSIPQATNALRIGDVVMNLDNFEVTLGGRPIDLTYKEYELLRFLATHKDRVHTRDTLLSQVWGYDYFGGTRTVDVHVRRLRTKIGDPNGVLIQTVRNVGYRLSEKPR